MPPACSGVATKESFATFLRSAPSGGEGMLEALRKLIVNFNAAQSGADRKVYTFSPQKLALGLQGDGAERLSTSIRFLSPALRRQLHTLVGAGAQCARPIGAFSLRSGWVGGNGAAQSR